MEVRGRGDSIRTDDRSDKAAGVHPPAPAPRGRLTIWRREGADWRIVKVRAEPVALEMVPCLRGPDVAVWTPPRGGPVVTAPDADTLSDFLADGPAAAALAS